MTTISWNNGVNADWTSAAAWLGNIVPIAGDDAVIDAPGSYTVTIAAAEAVTVHSATLNDAGATLAVAGTLSLASATPSLQVLAGAILLGGTIAGGTLALGANALTATGAAKLTGALDAAGGAITIDAGAVLTLANGGNLDASEQIDGQGTLATGGTLTIGSGGINLDASLVWNNSGTVNAAGPIDTDYPSIAGAVTINNLAGAAFDLTADGLAIYVGATTVFNDTGTLAKTGGSGTSSIDALLNSNGTLGAASGTLELDGGGTFGAKTTITGAGAVVLNGGSFTLAGATAVVAGTLALTGGVVQIGAIDTLTLSGATTWDTGTQIDGPGTLATTGTTSFSSSPSMAGSLVWNNSGVVDAAAQLDTDYIGAANSPTAGTMTIDNLAAGTFDITADDNVIYVGATTDFINAGTLSKIAGTGTSTFTDAIATTGTLTATSGTLELDGGGTLGGRIGATGAGRLVFGSGTFTLAGATQTVSGPLAITGGVIQIDPLKTLTLSGAITLDAGTQIDGAGALTTTGATGFAGSPSLAGSLAWNNSGTVTAAGQLDTDYDGATNAATTGTVAINNLATGVFDITADGTAIYVGSATTLGNAGTLEKTAGSSVSTIEAAVANTGTLAASTGTLELDGGGTLGGTVVQTATGAVEFGGGVFAFSGTVAAAGTVTFDNSATLAVAAVSGTISSASALGSAVNITGGRALTLAGATTWDTGTQIDGPGTLATTAATTFTTSPNLAGSLIWNNSGTVSAGIQLNTDYAIANNSPTTGTVVINNLAGGAFDLTADEPDAIYSGSTTDFNNIGTLAKTGGTGVSDVTIEVANTGTLAAVAGTTLELSGGGTFGASNAITGLGTVAIGGGIFTLLGPAAAITGALTLAGGTVEITTNKILTLSGAANWGNGAQVDGPGTLATIGTTTFTTSPSLAGSLVWNNSGLVSAGGMLDTDYDFATNSPTTGTVTINNLAGAAFDLTADGTAIYVGSTTVFNDTGTLAKVAGSGTSTISPLLNSDGTLTAASGVLELDGGGTFGANTSITGTGTVAINGGTFTVAATTAAIAGALTLNGGTVQIAGGRTLALTGAANWNGGTQIDGTGTLTTAGTTTFTTSPSLAGSLIWTNSGVVNAGTQLDTDYFGATDSPATGTVTIHNLANGRFDLTADGTAIYIGSTTNFDDDGQLTKTGGTGTSTVATPIVETTSGTIAANTGTLELDAGGTLDGAMGGTGNGVVALGNGVSFVTTASSAQATIPDAGPRNDVRIVNGATWTDSGLIEADGHLEIGNASGVSAFVISAAGALRFTADDGDIVNGGGGTLTNAGQLAKSAGTGTSTVGMPFTNTGTVLAASGTLKLANAVSGSGIMQIEGAATLELASGAVAATNTVDMDFHSGTDVITLRIDTNTSVGKPIIGLGAGSRIDLAAATFAAGVAAVINGNTLTITPAGGTALNFVSTGSLGALVITKSSDGGTGTTIALDPAPPPVVALNGSPSASNATQATLGTAAPAAGAGTDMLSVTLTSDADFPTNGAGSSALKLTAGTLIYTPGLVTQSLIGKPDTIQYTVTDGTNQAVTKEMQSVFLSDGPAPIVTLATTAPSASNITPATLGTAITGRLTDGLSVSLFADPKFPTGSSVVLNSGGTLLYQPGVVTAALVGTDSITYDVSDTITGAVTQKTQIVTLSAGSPPVVTLAVTQPTASNATPATLGTAAAGVAGDPLSVTLTSDPAFPSGSKVALSGGSLVYTPGGVVTALLAGNDIIKYTVADTKNGALVVETQTVTLSNGPGPIVSLAAAPSATNTVAATLGTAAPGLHTDALTVTLNSDADFATGSKLVLTGGSLVYTPGLVTQATVVADKLTYTVTDTVTGAVTKVAQTVTLGDGPAPIVTFAATAPAASNVVKATLGSATPGLGRPGDGLSVALVSDPKFATGSSIMLNSGTLVYQPGVVTAALAGSDSITYDVTDAITGAVTQKTQIVTLSDGAPPVVTLAATQPTASNATPATLGTAVAGVAGDKLSVTLTSDPAFATGSTVALSGSSLIYTPGGVVTALLAGNDIIKYTVTDTLTGALTLEQQTITLSNGPAPIVTLATAPSATNAVSATLGTAAPGVHTDALTVKLTSDADFATGSKLVLNTGSLVYTPGLVTQATVVADKLTYTVTDTVTGAVTNETQTVTLGNGPPPLVTLATTPIATNFTSALLGTAATGHATDALSVTLTSDSDFATGSKLALTNGNLIYTPGPITPAKAGSHNITYSVTDTLTGAVTTETQAVTVFDAILTLAAAPTTVTAAQEISLFIVPNGALDSRDNITGGPNNPNTLALTGPGVFDLNAPKVLTNIQGATATEGQAAYVSGATNIASTTQTIFLRDGLNVDLLVGAGTNNAANPNPRGIVIYGGNDSSVINLATGSDTVVLGSGSEKVFGGGGAALVQATAAFAGAPVVGAATGTTTLEIAGGGTAALNVNDTHVTVKLDAATVLTLSKAAFVTALGSSGNDSITAGAAGQVLTGGAGADTLTGFSGFGDTFSDTSAGLNGDTLKLFGGSDLIDLTDMTFANLKPLAFAAGVLTVTDGVHAAKIDFTGSYTLADFHPGTDGHTGTFISFV